MYWVNLFFVLFVIFGCKADSLKKIVKANTKFTINVYKELILHEINSFIISGLSAEIVLSLLADGALGETQKELLNALHLQHNQTTRDEAFEQLTTELNKPYERLKLLSANKIYLADGFPINETFNDTAVDVYNSEVENLNFENKEAAAKIINEWVENHTDEEIQNLIGPSQFSPATVLVLVNALYFSGKWTDAFEASNTKKRIFHTSETETKNIELMYTETFARCSHSSRLKAKFLELHFQDGNFSMNFILSDNKAGLATVENNLEKYFMPQKMKYVKVAISLPKFAINTKIDFVPILKQLGVKEVFTNHANLSKISSKRELNVSFIVQKACITVTEDGVGAEAAMEGGVSLVSGLGEPSEDKYFIFKADHPFFYYIKEKTSGAILFAGRFLGDDY